MSGLEEKVFGFGREAICSTGKRRKKEIWVLDLEEKGHGWFGRERFWDWKRSRLLVREKRRKKEIKKKKEDIFSFNVIYLVC